MTDADQTHLLLIDVQDRILPAVHDADRLVDALCLLSEAAMQCGIATSLSEHCPEKLGHTSKFLQESLGVISPIEKRSFSVFRDDQAIQRFKRLAHKYGKLKLVIGGIEAHVCVLLTAFDALASGYEVTVVADGVSSRRARDCEWALQALVAKGAIVLPVETLVFEWLDSVEHAAFRRLQRAIRDRSI